MPVKALRWQFARWLLSGTAFLMASLVGLSFRLSEYPGLHGDEAWAGLRAEEILSAGLASIHGMNHYTGALFPMIVAGAFALGETNILWLRLPGVILNIAGVLLLAFAFRNRIRAPLYTFGLFASSLFFLFYSRVAWEVTALENFLTALIVWSVTRIVGTRQLQKTDAAILLVAFSLGTYNHFIFSAAAISFTATASVLALRSLNPNTSRLFIISIGNLAVQTFIVVSKPLMHDGPFLTATLPWFAALIVIVGVTCVCSVRIEDAVLGRAMEFTQNRPAIRGEVYKYTWWALAACFLLILPFNGVSFIGMLSGVLVLERIASNPPNFLQGCALYLHVLVVGALWGWSSYRNLRAGPETDLVKALLLIWPGVFLIIMQIEAFGLSDRYFIIPQTILFAALATCIEDLPLPALRLIQCLLLLGIAHSQLIMLGEVGREVSRRPLDFRYGFYFDTSRHFVQQTSLSKELGRRSYCGVSSKSFFIAEPMKFIMPPSNCPLSRTAIVQYCDSCSENPHWFSIKPLVTAPMESR